MEKGVLKQYVPQGLDQPCRPRDGIDRIQCQDPIQQHQWDEQKFDGVSSILTSLLCNRTTPRSHRSIGQSFVFYLSLRHRKKVWTALHHALQSFRIVSDRFRQRLFHTKPRNMVAYAKRKIDRQAVRSPKNTKPR
jgi:hypothetical protein